MSHAMAKRWHCGQSFWSVSGGYVLPRQLLDVRVTLVFEVIPRPESKYVCVKYVLNNVLRKKNDLQPSVI